MKPDLQVDSWAVITLLLCLIHYKDLNLSLLAHKLLGHFSACTGSLKKFGILITTVGYPIFHHGLGCLTMPKVVGTPWSRRAWAKQCISLLTCKDWSCKKRREKLPAVMLRLTSQKGGQHQKCKACTCTLQNLASQRRAEPDRTKIILQSCNIAFTKNIARFV